MGRSRRRYVIRAFTWACDETAHTFLVANESRNMSVKWTGSVVLTTNQDVRICVEYSREKAEVKVAHYMKYMKQNGINTTTWRAYIARELRELH